MSPRSDRVLTWLGIGWVLCALVWCLLLARHRAERAMRWSEACFEGRAEAKEG